MSALLLTFLANAVWQVPLVAAVTTAADRLARSAPARHRHALWVAALVASLALPSIAAWSLWRAEGEPGPVIAIAPGDEGFAPGPALELPWGADRLVIASYLLFLLYRVAAFLWAFHRTAEMRRKASREALPDRLRAVARRAAVALGVRPVPVLFSRHVPGPITFGARRPLVLLPEHIRNEECEALWTSVLGHELAHVRRRDFALNVAFEIVALPLSFHPATTWIKRHIHVTREQACDDLVAQKLLPAPSYARSLVSLAQKVVASRGLSPSLAIFDPNTLEERIMRLLEARRAPRVVSLGLGAVALAVTTLVASSFSIAVEASQGPGVTLAIPISPLLGLGSQVEPVANDEFTYDSRGKRDPFVSPTAPVTTPPGGVPGIAIDAVKLQGVVKTSQGWTAMIAGPDNKTYFVSPGQSFYDGALVRIDAGGLTFKKEMRSVFPVKSTQEWRLELHK